MADLVESQDQVACCVKTLNAGPLMLIDDWAAVFGHAGTERDGKLRSNRRPERRINAGKCANSAWQVYLDPL